MLIVTTPDWMTEYELNECFPDLPDRSHNEICNLCGAAVGRPCLNSFNGEEATNGFVHRQPTFGPHPRRSWEWDQLTISCEDVEKAMAR